MKKILALFLLLAVPAFALTTREIRNTVPLTDQKGNVLKNVPITFTMVDANKRAADCWHVDGTRIAPIPATVKTSTFGLFSTSLAVTSQCTAARYYLCHIDSPYSGIADFLAPLDAGAGSLEWITFMAAGAVLNATGQGQFVGHTSDTGLHWTSAAQKTDLTDAGDSALHYHATDRARANHTGEQAISTVTGLAAAFTNESTARVAGLATKEPTITAGTTAQYLRGDKSLGTLNQAAVDGLRQADSPTFTGATFNGVVQALKGSVDSPTFSFEHAGSGVVGMYSPGSNELAFSVNGVARMHMLTYTLLYGPFVSSPSVGSGDYTSFDATASGLAIDVNNPGGGDVISYKFAGVEKARITDAGNLGLGTTSFGTSAAKVLAIGSGTAPTTSPADVVQTWSADTGGVAGKAGLHIRTEDGTSHVFGDKVGINTTTPTSPFQVVGLPVYANNAAAAAGGLTAGAFYRTGTDPDFVAVVH